MNGYSLLDGKFTVCTVLSLPKTNAGILGEVSFVDQSGRTVTAKFVFADGWRIIAGKDGPVFATGRHGFISVGTELVALTRFQHRVGMVLTSWGTRGQYGDALTEIKDRTFLAVPAPKTASLSGFEARMRRTMRTNSQPTASLHETAGAAG
jgi:hypothetical protein